jgi:hypothetical protein
MRDLDNSSSGLRRGFGLRPPRLLRTRWGGAVRQLITAYPMLMAAIGLIPVARATGSASRSVASSSATGSRSFVSCAALQDPARDAKTSVSSASS